jgi:redox-sensing transcriptional repressor
MIKDTKAALSTQALQRMPYYLQYLEKLRDSGVTVVAAPAVAGVLNLNEVQVRKDFASASPTHGKPKSGFNVSELIYNMERMLGYHNVNEAVLVGVGSLGRALLSYQGFDSCGMRIVAAFDNNENVVGSEINQKTVLPVSRLREICTQQNLHIGIITVPAEHAQEVCDDLVASGILAIWNFAPIHLTAPGEILIKNENMAVSLALLSKHLKERIGE